MNFKILLKNMKILWFYHSFTITSHLGAISLFYNRVLTRMLAMFSLGILATILRTCKGQTKGRDLVKDITLHRKHINNVILTHQSAMF